MNSDLLLMDGIAAAEGAQVVIESYFSGEERDPHNNDNYCRLVDWLRAARNYKKTDGNKNAGKLAAKWLSAERQYRAQVREASAAGTPHSGMAAHADQLRECRHELETSFGLERDNENR